VSAAVVSKWPFSRILDRRGNPTSFVALNGPVVTRADADLFATLRKQFRFVGFTSYTDFPRPYLDQNIVDWVDACEGWCHCFRNPAEFLPSGRVSQLISYSDFVDLRPNFPIDVEKRYDVAFVCADNSWKRYTKNWQLAKRCVTILSLRHSMRVVLIGVPVSELEGIESGNITFVPELERVQLLNVLSACRCLLIASEMDASPRLLAETLSLDVPVVVNRRILGGWKYVNRHTGRFFDDEHSVAAAVNNSIQHCNNPHRWFAANFGPNVTGRRLARFLSRIDPSFRETAAYLERWS